MEKKFTREPHIWDFYNPSDEMKEYMTLTIGISVSVWDKRNWGKNA